MTEQATTETTAATTDTGKTGETAAPVTTTATTDAAKPVTTETKTAEPDWRDLLAGEDKKFRTSLDRFTDPGAFGKSYLEAQKAITDGARVRIPGEDASEEERAAYAKARGIPESPDKYEIKVKPPEGMELSERDKDRLSQITANLHKMGGLAADPAVVNLAHQLFYAEREEYDAQAAANAEIAKEKTDSMLSKLWGSEKARNIGFADAAIQQFFGKDWQAIKDWRGADGVRLGDKLEFVKAFAAVGRVVSEDPVFLEAGRNGGDAAKTLEAERAELMSLRATNPGKYNSRDVQERLQQIYAAMERHNERSQGAH